MLERYPYFRFYSSEYLLDTLSLTSTEQHGAYLLLIVNYFWNGSLPADKPSLYAICHAMNESAQTAVDFVLGKFFHIEDGCFVHHRIERERIIMADRSEKAKYAGKLGGESKAAKTRKSSKPVPRVNGAVDMSGFKPFWNIYPRKEGKATAEKSWHALKPDAALVEQIMEAVSRQKDSAPWTRDKGKFIPHASTWLNGKRWQDESAPSRDPDDLVI